VVNYHLLGHVTPHLSDITNTQKTGVDDLLRGFNHLDLSQPI